MLYCTVKTHADETPLGSDHVNPLKTISTENKTKADETAIACDTISISIREYYPAITDGKVMAVHTLKDLATGSLKTNCTA